MVMPSCGGKLVWRPSLGRRAGYSLFEMLVALAILALAASFTLPSLTTGLAAAARHSVRLEAEQGMLALRRRALRDGEAIVIARNQIPPELTLSNSWVIAPEASIRIQGDGRCAGGVLIAQSVRSAESMRLELSPGDCRLVR